MELLKLNASKEKVEKITRKVLVKFSPQKPFGQAIFIQNEYSDDTQPLYQADCDEDYGGHGVSSSDMSSPDILRRKGILTMLKLKTI